MRPTGRQVPALPVLHAGQVAFAGLGDAALDARHVATLLGVRGASTPKEGGLAPHTPFRDAASGVGAVEIRGTSGGATRAVGLVGAPPGGVRGRQGVPLRVTTDVVVLALLGPGANVGTLATVLATQRPVATQTLGDLAGVAATSPPGPPAALAGLGVGPRRVPLAGPGLATAVVPVLALLAPATVAPPAPVVRVTVVPAGATLVLLVVEIVAVATTRAVRLLAEGPPPRPIPAQGAVGLVHRPAEVPAVPMATVLTRPTSRRRVVPVLTTPHGAGQTTSRAGTVDVLRLHATGGDRRPTPVRAPTGAVVALGGRPTASPVGRGPGAEAIQVGAGLGPRLVDVGPAVVPVGRLPARLAARLVRNVGSDIEGRHKTAASGAWGVGAGGALAGAA